MLHTTFLQFASQILFKMHQNAFTRVQKCLQGHSGVKYGVGVSHVNPSNCFRRLEKLVLPSIFDTSFIVDDVKLAELSNSSFEWKNVTFLGRGIKTYSDPSYIFSGGSRPQPPGSTPLQRHKCRIASLNSSK